MAFFINTHIIKMTTLKKVLAICGSTRIQSSNLQLLKAIKELARNKFEIHIFEELSKLPHFNPDLDKDPLDENVSNWRQLITEADGILICTPEYVFSLPGALKNGVEWLVSTTILSKKPTALITASSLGEKAHEQLLLIMKTVEAHFTENTQLHISGVRSKINDQNEIIDNETLIKTIQLIDNLEQLLNNK